MKILTYLKIILIGSIGLIALFGIPTDCNAEGIIQINPHIETALPTEPVNLYISIDEDVETVKGYLIDISVDTNIVKLDSCFHTAFFPGFFLYWKLVDSGNSPMYEVLDVLLGSEANVNGPGDLVGLAFTAANPGISRIGFKYVLLTDTVGIEGDTIALADSLDGYVVVCSPGQAMILSDPFELEFLAQPNSSNPPAQVLTISNPCFDDFSWTASESATWFELSQYSGQADDQISITVDITGLSAGQYSETIIVEATGAFNTPIAVDVGLILEGPDYICGDANGDLSVNVSDAVYIINYVFSGGAAPDPLAAGDGNCDFTCNVSDAVYIINYVFTGGNPPCDVDGDSEPDC